jgi:group I intron endonuclease
MYIYKTTNLINGKIYIGKSEKHFNPNYYGSGILLKKSVKKYGIENFSVELIEKCDSIEELNYREKYWILQYIDNSYNIAEGGTGGWTTKNYTSEQKLEYGKLLSEIRKGRKHSEETIQKLKIMHSGKNFGDSEKVSETIKKLWKDPNSIYNSKEYRNRLSIASKKRIWTDETKEKIRQSKIGSKNPVSIKIEVDGVIFETRRECAKHFKISEPAVTKRCKSKNFENWKIINKKN